MTIATPAKVWRPAINSTTAHSTTTPSIPKTMFAALRASTSRAGARAFSTAIPVGTKMPLRAHRECAPAHLHSPDVFPPSFLPSFLSTTTRASYSPTRPF